ncbi:SAM-dependent methyltransferase, partial [Bradyrhizobium sp.]|uniref:SAM-dependent methyltransferase n=1 Tax=Bradyrhizobium sp. TaxID=376 RepID=UPI003C1850C7
MSRKTTTLTSDYFEDKYLGDIDPLNFRSSDYERNKYAATVAALGKQRYRSALEIGCSIGVLTGLLASRSQEITAIDASATAIAAARQSGIANALFITGSVPRDFPPGRFDLIVLSEVLYYFVAGDLARVAERCGEALQSDGEIVLCHWLGETDYPLTGEAASEIFARHISRRLPVRTIVRDDVYRLERFSRQAGVGGGA